MARVKSILAATFALLLMLLAAAPASAQATPDKHQETVYNGEIFDGQGYGGQFYPQGEATIYVMADVQNVLVPKQTLVYWWQITHEYKADWESMDQVVTGTLEIGDLKFPMGLYSLRYDGGYDSAKTSLLLGDAAKEGRAASTKAMADYNDDVNRYNNARAIYQDMLTVWGKAVDDARAKGEPTDTIPVPKEPVAPTQPTVTVTEPAGGIAFKLPAGQYQMRLRGQDGQIVAGSERTIVAFGPRRSGLAYKVIAASKYTVPDASTDPHDTIFVSGEKTLYVQPAAEAEYDAYYTAKLMNSQDRAAQDRRGIWTWLPAGNFGGEALTLSMPGAPQQTIQKGTYYAKQTPGSALGYAILPYDASAGAGVSTFQAFMLQPQAGTMTITAPGVAGSSREIRVVQTGAGGALLALSFLPLVGGLSWLFFRRWRTK